MINFRSLFSMVVNIKKIFMYVKLRATEDSRRLNLNY